MWSAYQIDGPRKGMKYFITILEILKYLLKDNNPKGVVLVICARPDTKYTSILKELNISNVIGFLDRDAYNSALAASDIYCSTTIADAGPRTTYESAAMATPVISFDNCNASDFVTDKNGALIDTYDVKKFAEEIKRFMEFSPEQKKETSLNMYEVYKEKMDSKKLAQKWQDFFEECEKNEQLKI